MKTGAFVVRPQTAWEHRFFHVFLIVLLLILGWGLYQFGQYRAGFNLLGASASREKLLESIQLLEKNKIDLREELTYVKRSNQVDEQAYKQVKSNLKLLRQEISELREEVSFYRGIVSPRENSTGVRINSFNVTNSDGKNLYHFDLVLTQVMNNNRSIRGSAKLIIEGVQNGRPKNLSLDNVSVKKNTKLEFKFRYFQKIEGDIVLPKGFGPRQIVVEVSAHKKKKIKRKFDWPKIVSSP